MLVWSFAGKRDSTATMSYAVMASYSCERQARKSIRKKTVRGGRGRGMDSLFQTLKADSEEKEKTTPKKCSSPVVKNAEKIQWGGVGKRGARIIVVTSLNGQGGTGRQKKQNCANWERTFLNNQKKNLP